MATPGEGADHRWLALPEWLSEKLPSAALLDDAQRRVEGVQRSVGDGFNSLWESAQQAKDAASAALFDEAPTDARDSAIPPFSGHWRAEEAADLAEAAADDAADEAAFAADDAAFAASFIAACIWPEDAASIKSFAEYAASATPTPAIKGPISRRCPSN